MSCIGVQIEAARRDANTDERDSAMHRLQTQDRPRPLLDVVSQSRTHTAPQRQSPCPGDDATLNVANMYRDECPLRSVGAVILAKPRQT